MALATNSRTTSVLKNTKAKVSTDALTHAYIYRRWARIGVCKETEQENLRETNLNWCSNSFILLQVVDQNEMYLRETLQFIQRQCKASFANT